MKVGRSSIVKGWLRDGFMTNSEYKKLIKNK